MRQLLARTKMIEVVNPSELAQMILHVMVFARLFAAFSKPHIRGQNCETVTVQSTTALIPKQRSLNLTVGSGLAGCRAAYCSRMTGE